ncbi:MAG TPA: hypothetical protein VM871_07445 [Flavisolibacter sp.]|nr:hypothetical protein [Flavisolibacter sp.]
MKKLSLITRLTTVAFATALLITGCKKESSDTLSAQEEEQAAAFTTESEVESDVMFDDVQNNVMGVNGDLGVGGVGIFSRTKTYSQNGREASVDSMPSCITVTLTPQAPNTFPKTVIMDFGAGCYSHGRLRSGKMITVFTGKLREPGSSATTTFDNFKIDSVKVEGTHKITNTTGSTPGANLRQYKIEVLNGKLTKPNGNYVEWDALRTQTQIEGNGSLTPSDDIFKVDGTANGRVKRSNLIVLWNSAVTEPLIKKFTCRWISKGRIRTVRQGLPANTPWVAILDYGAGTCDNTASLTINGNTQQITLH